jgi:hypothetical protein
MNIETPITNFEQSKLLKEKEFNIPISSFYEYALTSKNNKQDGYSGPFGWKKGECNLQSGYFINNSEHDLSNKNWLLCGAPNYWQVVEWLTIKFRIEIVIEPTTSQINFEEGYNYSIWDRKSDKVYTSYIVNCPVGEPKFRNRQEAYSAAFDYILKELI